MLSSWATSARNIPLRTIPSSRIVSTGWVLLKASVPLKRSTSFGPLLEKADVDAKNRKIIWEDGQRLSITESVQRIHAKHPHLALELIEERLIGWLEMAFAPAGYSETQLDELDRLTEKWIEDSPGRPKTGNNSALLRRIL
jgi:hypothetical protein